MSLRCLTWVLHESPATGNDRLVLIAIADEADDDGANAFPSMPRIAHKARVSRATAMRAVARLELGGEILVRRPATRGRGRFNRYAIVGGRNPLELAALYGWPAPDLDAGVRAEWLQTDTINDGPQPGENCGENSAAEPGNGPKWLQERPLMVAPSATRPVLPIDPRVVADGTADNRPAARRRLDSKPDLGEAQVAAGLAIAHANDRERTDNYCKREPDPETLAAIRATRAAIRRTAPVDPDLANALRHTLNAELEHDA